MTTKLTENRIAKGLAHGILNDRSILVVPRCGWCGSECDLLVVTRALKIIDVEIKISRSDLKADAKKEKWWRGRPWSRRGPGPRRWPDKVWKHYYAVDASIWHPDLLASISDASGVILVKPDARFRGGLQIEPIRRAIPCREAQPITPADAIDIARLASLRMWSALTKDELP